MASPVCGWVHAAAFASFTLTSEYINVPAIFIAAGKATLSPVIVVIVGWVTPFIVYVKV